MRMREILTEHIRSLGFWDIKEGVTLRSLRCISSNVLLKSEVDTLELHYQSLLTMK